MPQHLIQEQMAGSPSSTSSAPGDYNRPTTMAEQHPPPQHPYHHQPQQQQQQQQQPLSAAELGARQQRKISKLTKKKSGFDSHFGDWFCAICGNSNYAFRQACNICTTVRSAAEAPAPPHMDQAPPQAQRQQQPARAQVQQVQPPQVQPQPHVQMQGQEGAAVPMPRVAQQSRHFPMEQVSRHFPSEQNSRLLAAEPQSRHFPIFSDAEAALESSLYQPDAGQEYHAPLHVNTHTNHGMITAQPVGRPPKSVTKQAPCVPMPAGAFVGDAYSNQAAYPEEYGLHDTYCGQEYGNGGGKRWNESGPVALPSVPRGGTARHPPGLDADAVSWSNTA
jgi:hypothetical protein